MSVLAQRIRAAERRIKNPKPERGIIQFQGLLVANVKEQIQIGTNKSTEHGSRC